MKKSNKDLVAPTAIILANQRAGEDLQTIFGSDEVSSLIVAGYSVLEHLLMELQDLNFQQCIVLVEGDASLVQKLVGDPRRWGLTVTVMNYSLSTDQVMREYKSLSEPSGLLVMELDRLRGHCVETFLNAANNSDYTLLTATSGGEALGVTLLKSTKSDFIINPMPLEIEGVKTTELYSAADFQRANFDVMAGVFGGLSPSVCFNNRTGLRQHWESNVHKKVATAEDSVMIDRHCHVAQDVSLNSVILNHDVFVEKNVSLDNTIVMPNNIVATAGRPIRDSIINNGLVYQVH